MEFLEYKEMLRELKPHGVAPREDGALVRFHLIPTGPTSDEVFSLMIGDAAALEAASNAGDRVEKPRDALPGLVDKMLHKLHLNQVMLVPASNWKSIINAVVFDIATDESWLEIDAEASLHQNGRDPLLVEPRDLHILKPMLNALMTNAEGPEQDLTILPLGAKMVLEFRCAGSVRIMCDSPAMIDELERIATH